MDATLMDFIVPYHSNVVGKPLLEIGLPHGSVIALVSRNDKYIVPTGTTVLEPGDVLLILLNKDAVPELNRILSAPQPQQS